LRLFVVLLVILIFEEDISSAVEDDMSSFVKERKPQVVVSFVT